MPTTLLVAPAACGKTDHCIKHIRATLRANPLAPVQVVLPDRQLAQAFRSRLAGAGGAIGVRIGTFGDVYTEILQRAGGAVPLAPETLVQRLLRAALQQLHAAAALPHYGPIAHTPGLLAELRARIAELKRACVQPAALAQLAADQGDAGLADLARIYAAYQERLQALGWADAEGINWLAIAALERTPLLASDWRLLVVDGFDSFTGAQLATLQLLAGVVPDTLVTLPGAAAQERVAHRRFARPLRLLRHALPGEQVASLPDGAHLPAPLAHLERALFEAAPEPAAPQEQIRMLAARTPADEAREALRWLKARVVRDAVPPSSCAVIMPNQGQYRPLLRAAADEFGLPLRFTQGEALASAAPMLALRDLLALLAHDFSRRSLLDTCRTPYLDLSPVGLAPHDAAPLDAVSQYGQVTGGLAAWRAALDRLARLAPREGDAGAGGQWPQLPRGAAAAALRAALDRLAARLLPPAPQPPVAWAAWLQQLLADFQLVARGVTARDQLAVAQLRATLQSFVLGATVAGATAAVPYEQFLAELHALLEATRCDDAPGPAIMVADVLEVRGLRMQAVAVLGFAEGVFPVQERADPFLSEAVRAALGLELRLGREQGGLCYQAVTRADAALLLTRPCLAAGGEPWEPSPYWGAIRNATAADATEAAAPAPSLAPMLALPFADAASVQELLFWAVLHGSLPDVDDAAIRARWQVLRHGRAVLRARHAALPAGPFEGDLQTQMPLLAARFGPDHTWSPSGLETYGSCAFGFFAGRVLRQHGASVPQPGMTIQQHGTLLHEILEQTYAGAGATYDLDTLLAALQRVAPPLMEQAPATYGFAPTPLWAIEQQQLLASLRETVRQLAHPDDSWTPIAFEQPFGRLGVAPILIPLGTEHVRVRGTIDRVDRAPDGGLRLIDYKTGGDPAKQDLIDGRRLQLPLYALAATQLGLGTPVEGLYWSIRRAKASALKLSAFDHTAADDHYAGVAGAIALVQQHVGRTVAGVRAGAFAPTPPPGGCPGFCAAAAWCWRYTPRNSYGH